MKNETRSALIDLAITGALVRALAGHRSVTLFVRRPCLSMGRVSREWPASSPSPLALVWARFATRPDHVRALQSHMILNVANEALSYMRQGLTEESAQAVCRIVLAGHRGCRRRHHRHRARPWLRRGRRGPSRGGRTDHHAGHSRGARAQRAPHARDARGDRLPARGLPASAAIVVPLEMRGSAVGTLKFYYTTPKLLNETQIAMAEGLAQVLSTQLELSELERQTELATRMELKALQAQINPHFLFNTINTIAVAHPHRPGARARAAARVRRVLPPDA